MSETYSSTSIDVAENPDVGWFKNVGKEIKPSSWGECVSLLLALGGADVLYRGHRCFEWNLETTLERGLQKYAKETDASKYDLMHSAEADPDTDQWASKIEADLTRYFQRTAVHLGIPDLPATWDVLGWWELMQHHGAPTRLLDWTRSPFIAIWFALESHRDECGDMVLWIYNIKNAYQNHPKALETLRGHNLYDKLDDRQRQNEFVKIALDDNDPALIPVMPRPTARAIAQQSVLTVSPTIGVHREANWWIRKELATRIRLREEWRSDMEATCQSVGLSRPRLFLDLDSLGDYITSNFHAGLKLPELF